MRFLLKALAAAAVLSLIAFGIAAMAAAMPVALVVFAAVALTLTIAALISFAFRSNTATVIASPRPAVIHTHSAGPAVIHTHSAGPSFIAPRRRVFDPRPFFGPRNVVVAAPSPVFGGRRVAANGPTVHGHVGSYNVPTRAPVREARRAPAHRATVHGHANMGMFNAADTRRGNAGNDRTPAPQVHAHGHR